MSVRSDNQKFGKGWLLVEKSKRKISGIIPTKIQPSTASILNPLARPSYHFVAPNYDLSSSNIWNQRESAIYMLTKQCYPCDTYAFY